MGLPFAGVLDFIDALTASDLRRACNIETSAGPTVLVTSADELLTVIRMDGIYDQVSSDEIRDKVEALETLLNGLLESPHHEIQWVQAWSGEIADGIYDGYRRRALMAAKTLGLNQEILSALVDEQIGIMKRSTMGETGYLVLRTLPTILPPSTLKEARRKQARVASKTGTGKRLSAAEQPLVSGLPDMLEMHQAQVAVLTSKLSLPPLNFVLEVLEKHEAIRVLARMVDPDRVASQWQPRLPGDPLPRRQYPGRPVREWHPTVASQIFRTPMLNAGSVVRIGDRWHGPVYMVVPPKKAEAFNDLVRQVPRSFEWRYSITLLGGKNRWLGKIKNRRFWTSLIKLFNSTHNGAILDSADTLIELSRMNEQMCGVRVTATVSAPTEEEARKRQAVLLRAMQAWGFADARVEEGDPALLQINTLPGLDTGAVAPSLIAPVQESTLMLPLARPASPWAKRGALLFQTLQRTPFPFTEGSDKQSYSVSLLFAPPGSGKSVMLNLLNLASCLESGQKRLPRIAILDIGPSSKGLIMLLKALLPEGRKHEAEFYVMRDRRDSAINPFDTMLGVRYPTAPERGFLTNFLALLLTPAGTDKAVPLTGEFASTLIDEAYRYYAEKAPKRYEETIEPKVDALLAQYPDLQEKAARNQLAWWDLVDRFMEDGYHEEAGLAQRNAVPLVPDLPQILSESRAIQDTYGRNEEFIRQMMVMLESVIKDYPLLTAPTRFNPASARVVAIDLMEAAKSSSGFERKRAGLIYMLGRHALAREFFFDEELAEHFPATPRKYHVARLREERTSIKRLIFDEYHRTSSLEAVRDQVKKDAREGRKYKVQLALASQLYEDFDADLQELASTLYILKADNEAVRGRLADEFSLNAAAQYALRHHVHGAGPEGASFLLWSRLKRQVFTQTLVSRIGPIQIWAFSTTPEDAALRDRLAGLVGYGPAIRILAKEIPLGSISSEIGRLEAKDEEDTIAHYIEQRALELAEKARRLYGAS